MAAIPGHVRAAATSEGREVGPCEAEAIRRRKPEDVQIWASQIDEILSEFGREIDELERSVDGLANRARIRESRRHCVSDGSRLATKR